MANTATRSSTRKVLQQFLTSTSVKGIPKLVKSDTTFLRVLWLLTLLAGSGIATYFVQGLIIGFVHHDVLTIVEETKLQFRFPDLTLCNVNPLGSLGTDAEVIRYLLALVTANNQTHPNVTALITPQLLFEYLLAHDAELQSDLLPFIVACKFTLQSGVQEECGPATVRVVRTDFGFCHTIHAADNKSIVAASIVVHVDDTKNFSLPDYHLGPTTPMTDGVILVVHEANTIPDIQDGMSVGVGKLSLVKFQEEMRRLIPSPYSQCQQDPQFTANTSLPPDLIYTKQACRQLCLQNAVINKCDCLVGHYMSVEAMRNNTDFCPFSHDVKSVDDVMAALSEKWQCHNEAQDLTTLHLCHDLCPSPCFARHYSVWLSSIDWPHSSQQIGFYKRYIRNEPYLRSKCPEYEDILTASDTDFARDFEMLQRVGTISRLFGQVNVEADSEYVLQYRDTQKVTPAILLGTVGGILNLWVGISFVTLIELLELIYHLLVLRIGPKDSTKTEPVCELDDSCETKSKVSQL